jgi:hypothetical protein
MNSLFVTVAALALAMPSASVRVAPEVRHEASPHPPISAFGPSRRGPDAFQTFRDGFRSEAQDQVRIEQHVIIRITPSPPSVRREMFAPPPQLDGHSYKEKKFDDCVAIDDIAGITPMSPNRLVLFMRGHKMLSAALERACDPDAFYLGAYVDRNPDGKLCTGRDTLRSRTGATCRLAKISRLVAVKD